MLYNEQISWLFSIFLRYRTAFVTAFCLQSTTVYTSKYCVFISQKCANFDRSTNQLSYLCVQLFRTFNENLTCFIHSWVYKSWLTSHNPTEKILVCEHERLVLIKHISYLFPWLNKSNYVVERLVNTTVIRFNRIKFN